MAKQQSKQRVERSVKELQYASNRVFYEWQMFSCMEVILSNSPIRPFSNAYIESAVIHARNLTYFLYKNPGNARSDDAIAQDFFPFGNTYNWQLPESLDKKHFGIYADWQIAHIVYTTDKIEWVAVPDLPGSHPWRFTEIGNAIEPALCNFIELASIGFLGNYWIDYIDNMPMYRWEKLMQLIKGKMDNRNSENTP